MVASDPVLGSQTRAGDKEMPGERNPELLLPKLNSFPSTTLISGFTSPECVLLPNHRSPCWARRTAGQPSQPPVSCGTIQEDPSQNHTPGDSSQGSPRQALPQQKHQPEKGHLFGLQLRASVLCPLWPLGFRLPEAGNSQGGFGGFVLASSSPQKLREGQRAVLETRQAVPSHGQ